MVVELTHNLLSKNQVERNKLRSLAFSIFLQFHSLIGRSSSSEYTVFLKKAVRFAIIKL